MQELSAKFKVMKKTEMDTFQQLYNINFPGRNFKEGEVIDLDSDDDNKKGGGGNDASGGGCRSDAMMILDSSEEEDDGIDKKKGNNQERNEKKGSDWGEYDDGDADFWGVDEKKSEENAGVLSTNEGKKNEVENGDKNKADRGGEVGAAGDADRKNILEKEEKSNESSSGENHEGMSSREKVPEKIYLNADSNVKQVDLNGISNSNGLGDDNETDKKVEKLILDDTNSPKELSKGKSVTSASESEIADAHVNKKTASKDTSSHDGKLTFVGDVGFSFSSADGTELGAKQDKVIDNSSDISSQSKFDNNSVSKSADADASNDSDDVICIETGSESPNKLHQYLSESRSQDLDEIDTRSVQFMSCHSSEPAFVAARVGFKSWSRIVNFNFSGDPCHLPVAMSVECSDKDKELGMTCPSVYERIYPQVRVGDYDRVLTSRAG